jgi:hypothetical protein
VVLGLYMHMDGEVYTYIFMHTYVYKHIFVYTYVCIHIRISICVCLVHAVKMTEGKGNGQDQHIFRYLFKYRISKYLISYVLLYG